MYKKIINKLRK